MLDWVAKVFRSWIKVILLAVLIGFVIVGGMIGELFEGQFFLGALFGLAVGLIYVIISGGLIVNFLTLVDSVVLLRKKICGDNLQLQENKNIGNALTTDRLED